MTDPDDTEKIYNAITRGIGTTIYALVRRGLRADVDMRPMDENGDHKVIRIYAGQQHVYSVHIDHSGDETHVVSRAECDGLRSVGLDDIADRLEAARKDRVAS